MNIFAFLLAIFGSVGGIAGTRPSGKPASPNSKNEDTAGGLAGDQNGMKSESHVLEAPESEPQPEPEPEPQPDNVPGNTDPEPEPEPEQEPQPQPEPEQEPQPDNVLGNTDPEPQPETETENGTIPDPAPTPGPAPEPSPAPPVQSGGSGEDGGDVANINLPATETAVSVESGRVATLDVPTANVASVKILTQPGHGHVSVNPDNTLALVLTETSYSGPLSFQYQTTDSEGTTATHQANLDVSPRLYENGWGTSEDHYMLEADAEDRVVVEHGTNHREVYVSGADDALTLADIAALEGLDISQINGSWLTANPQYGGSEGMALAEDAGKIVWDTVAWHGTESSNWLLFERGHTYDDMAGIINRGASGESELHPLYVGAWGTGDRPEVTSRLGISHTTAKNIVFQDIHFSGGALVLDAENILFDNVQMTEDEMTFQSSSGITIRNSEFFEIHRATPLNDGDDWHAHLNRVSGIYANTTDGILLEGNFFDHIGWEDGYHWDTSDAGGQPPSMFSHDIYLDARSTDVTLRDSVMMRAASFGAQVRPGGFIENNAFIDNNGGVYFDGGYYLDPADIQYGNYSLFMDNVVTSGAHKTVAASEGALTIGVEHRAHLSSLVDNIVAHLADPNNPSELLSKEFTHPSVGEQDPSFYNDTIVWNWSGLREYDANKWPDENIDGLNPTVLDQTTIQLFAAQLLSKPDATIADLADYLRAKAEGELDNMADADLIVDFFQKGFGIAPDIRTDDGLIRFIPDDLGDGVRWDNRLNWSSEDLPGSVTGDSVDLGGNKVVYGGTTTIGELEFGANGGLQLEHGKLTVTEGLETGSGPATLDVSGAGQIWTEGAKGTGRLDIDVDGGRFANTGRFQANSELTSTDGQTILAADTATYAVTNGSRLEVVGDDAEVGFDGETGGIAILGLGDDSTLAYTARDGGLGTIEEFRSGALGDAPDVHSGADLGGGALEIDITDLLGAGGEFTLLEVDELIGIFDSTNVTGLSGQNAEIIVDYEADAVRLKLSAGSGEVNVTSIGAPGDVSAGEDALWAALTTGQGTYDDALPADDDEDFLFVA